MDECGYERMGREVENTTDDNRSHKTDILAHYQYGGLLCFRNRFMGRVGRIRKKPIGINMILGGEEFFRFYNMELLAGEWISEKSDRQEVNIMESTARRMGWTPQEAIGKHFSNSKISPYTIVGVIKDCAYKSPTADLPYTAFVNTYQEQWAWSRGFVLFKYKPGTWEECRLRIEEMQQTELPDKKLFLFNEEEQYNNIYLLKMLYQHY